MGALVGIAGKRPGMRPGTELLAGHLPAVGWDSEPHTSACMKLLCGVHASCARTCSFGLSRQMMLLALDAGG